MTDAKETRAHAFEIKFVVDAQKGERARAWPLISEDLFYRVQSVLSGRVPITTPQQRAHPDFPLRAFVRGESCGRGLTGSWSKNANPVTIRSDDSQKLGPSRISDSARSAWP